MSGEGPPQLTLLKAAEDDRFSNGRRQVAHAQAALVAREEELPAVDPDLEPEPEPLTWRAFLDLWARTRIAHRLAVEDLTEAVRGHFEPLLPKYSPLQWAGCLERYLDRARSKGLEAAKRGWPLRMLKGSVFIEAMPEREERGRICCVCRESALHASPTGRALCGRCSEDWFTAFAAAVPPPPSFLMKSTLRNPELTDEECREINQEALAVEQKEELRRRELQPEYFARWLEKRERGTTAAG